MEDSAVKVGHMLFTMVDPPRGEEVAYNRWYERDHFYAGCLVGPWLFAGRRWVAPRALKALRYPEGGGGFARPDVRAGSYVALYDLGWAVYRDADLVPVELALDHASPVAAATSWTPVPQRGAPMDIPVVEDPDRLRTHLFFLDVDALRTSHRFERLGWDLEASGLGRVVFASPWLPTIVGTDIYTDELW